MSIESPSFPDKIPRGLRGLSNPNRNLLSTLSDKEQLQQEAMAVERWWSQSRWKHTKRIYSGTNVFGVLGITVNRSTHPLPLVQRRMW